MNASEKIQEFCRNASYTDENLFVRKLRAGGLSDEQIASVIETMESTCKECWNREAGCRCWLDL